MAEEGEPPDYLDELDKSLPSAEAYKEDARREFQIAQLAWHLGIPKDSLSNATVHRYIGVLHELHVAVDGEWQDGLEPAEDSPREDRENHVRGLHGTALMLLDDGFDTQLNVSDIKHGFDRLARRYGGEVRYNYESPAYDQASTQSASGHRFQSASGPLWTGRSHSEPEPQVPWPGPHDQKREWSFDSSWWWDLDRKSERDDRERRAELAAEAQRQGVPADRLRRDPVTRGLLARLVDARRLVADTTDLSGLPEAPGLTPSARERLAGIAPLNRLAVGVLEEQFHPGSLSPSRVTGELNQVGRAYGLKIH